MFVMVNGFCWRSQMVSPTAQSMRSGAALVLPGQAQPLAESQLRRRQQYK